MKMTSLGLLQGRRFVNQINGIRRYHSISTGFQRESMGNCLSSRMSHIYLVHRHAPVCSYTVIHRNAWTEPSSRIHTCIKRFPSGVRTYATRGEVRSSGVRNSYLLDSIDGLQNISQKSPGGDKLLQTHSPSIVMHNGFRTCVACHKEESKLEKTVKVLKDKAEEGKKKEASKPVIGTPIAPQPAEETVTVAKKKSLGQRIVDELKHYYSGFKLLFIDVKICVRLLWILLKGKSLTRRERKQLVRTTADLFRLVPFLVFVIVPFMEFLLPVALKLFPNMLPSTFSEENKEQEKIKKKLKVKLEMAKFLQNTIEESALQKRKKTGEEVTEFAEFIEKMKNKAVPATNEEIIKFSKLFEDEITLDNLSRPQLLALCKLVELPAVGTNIMLEFQLRMRLRQLKFDDKMIAKEGIENLTTSELQQAVRERGMRALGVPRERLEVQLEQWLDLHLKEKIPSSLLLLSRTLFLPETVSAVDQLKETLAKLPEKSAEEVKLKVAETAGEVDNKTKLELIKQEEAAILREKQEIESTERALKEEAEAKARAEAEAVASQTVAEELVDSAPVVAAKPQEDLEPELKKEDEEPKEEELSSQDLETIECVLEQVAEEKKFAVEKEELRQIKDNVSEYQEDLEDLREVVALSGGHGKDLTESKAAKRLSKKLNAMISHLDGHIDELQTERMDLMEEIEVREVKMKRNVELRGNDEKMQDMRDTIQEKKDCVISINEMVEALKRLQKVPDDTRLQRIAEVLDEDKDGQIEVDHLLKVMETLGSENVKLSGSQVSRVIDLMKKEFLLEEEEKILEKQEKELQKQENTQ